MSQRCDFIDIQSNENSDTQIKSNTEAHDVISSKPTVEGPAYPRPDSDELKEHLKAHKSYNDFLAIIRTGKDDYQRRRNAEKVLEVLQQLGDQEIKVKSERLKNLKCHASLYVFRTQADKIKQELGILKNKCLSLQSTRAFLHGSSIRSMTMKARLLIHWLDDQGMPYPQVPWLWSHLHTLGRNSRYLGNIAAPSAAE
jgi:hypothetical protein